MFTQNPDTPGHRKVCSGNILDISGAFENAWWPLILWKLNEAACPRELYQLIQSYLIDRTAILQIGHVRKSKTLTKGCPQGSVLGPILWNVLFEDLLRTDLGPNVTIQAYANDAVVIVRANTRLDLENSGTRALYTVHEWCMKAKLTLSLDKTHMILLNGETARTRPPHIRLHNHTIQYTQAITYLGITFSERINCLLHLTQTTEKLKKTHEPPLGPCPI